VVYFFHAGLKSSTLKTETARFSETWHLPTKLRRVTSYMAVSMISGFRRDVHQVWALLGC
jgi:hypothetical protein